MNPLDLIAILLIVTGAVLGFRSGALPQVGGLIGAIGGAAIVVLALPLVTDQLGKLDPTVRPFLVLGGLLVVVALGESVGSTLGRRIATSLGTGVLSAADRVAGAFVGVAQGLLIIWLVGGLLALAPMLHLTEAAQTSKAVRALNAVLPPPGDFAMELGRMLDSTGLPAVFVGFEPLPQAPVDLPNDPTARRLAAAALSSTLKVSAGACGYTSSGTGFAVAGDYVVTNAHVVAGMSSPSVQVGGVGTRVPARVVLFDPRRDIAVLLVKGLPAPALGLGRTLGRGADAVVAGFPRNGPFTSGPARVRSVLNATGDDIYGRSGAVRQVFQLYAKVEPGNSGGPLLATDGTLAGIVFAKSLDSPSTGYALTLDEARSDLSAGLTATAAVSTGGCAAG